MRISYVICAITVGFIICALTSPSSAVSEKNSFFVDTNGNDLNPGTKLKPFATLEHARDAIRDLKQKNGLPAGGVTVQIRGGLYRLAKSFELNEKDSGNKTSPVVYRSFNNEEVHLLGSQELSGFSPVADSTILKRLDAVARVKVVQVNLKSLGITDYGELKPRGMGKYGITAALELFFNNKPMTLARWPNSGWEKISATPAGQKGGRFTYDGDRPIRWSKADDIWLHGYWTWNWADSYVKVASTNTISREIITQEPHGVYGYKAGGRYYALNILEELDQPGEWYLDRKSGILYFWPPAPLTQGKASVSILPAIISLRNTSHVSIQGITVEQCRGTAVTIDGGTSNRIAGCTIRNVGNNAVNIEGGTNNGVQSCDISQCGERGIKLSGGDRKTLVAASNFAVNNRIHDFSQWGRTNNPGIAISGVGNRIANNLIYNAPHAAIILNGNEHVIENNEIHNVCLDTSDAGAFYMGRDYSERGNIIRYNFIHDINMGNVQAIYLDDYASGTTVYGNVISKAGRGIMIGGGRNNDVRNNVFNQCNIGIHVDARGKGGGLQKFLSGKGTIMSDRLADVNYKEPPYSTKYPELLFLYNGDPAEPVGNSIINNIFYGGKWLDLKKGVTESILNIKGNFVGVDPGFVDASKMNFQLKDNSPAFKLGFKRIPMDKIGLFVDEYRKQLD